MHKISHLLKFTFRDILSQKKLNLFFCINLMLGFLGFLLLQIFQTSLSVQSKQKAQETLGGDIVISARRAIDEKEILNIEKLFSEEIAKRSHTRELFAMVKNNDSARLVLIKAVDQFFPLFGSVDVTNDQNQEIKISTIQKNDLWIDPDVQNQLKVNLQSGYLKIGKISLKVSGLIKNDPSRAFRFGTLAPYMIISYENLITSDLIKPGSTMTTAYLYKLKNPQKAQEIKNLFDQNIKDPAIQLTSALQEDGNNNQIFKYLIDYLGLVSLVALGLSFLCLSYMLNWFFQINKKNIAIYRVLGVSEKHILQYSISKNLLLSCAALLFSIFILLLIKEPIQNLLTNYFRIPLDLIISTSDLINSFFIVLLGPQLIAIPAYIMTYKANPLDLLKQKMQNYDLGWRIYLFWGLLVTLSFWLLAVWQSHSLLTANFFIFGILVAVLFVVVLIKIFSLAVDQTVHHFSFKWKYALISLVRKQQSTYLIFVTMTISILVLTLLPHLKKSIIEEIKPNKASQIPSLFMFDIQIDQKNGVAEKIEKIIERKVEFTPLVRSRILKINDRNYERAIEPDNFQTREEEAEARFRNRGVNLTYKDRLQDSETLVSGQWFNPLRKNQESSEILPEISLEKKYAERVNAKIGDIILFDVQGLEIKGQVTSLRSVRWTSFQPNFFIVFQPGYLEEAPQNFLSSIGNLTDEQVNLIQAALVDQYPNISIINVRSTVEKSLVFIDQMSLALQIMAWLSLVVGFFVFIILLNTQISERLNEMNLLQVMGLNTHSIVQILTIQFTIIVGGSLLLGSALGSGLSFFLIKTLFKIQLTLDFQSLIITSIVLMVLTAVIIKIVLRPLYVLQPMALLKAEGTTLE